MFTLAGAPESLDRRIHRLEGGHDAGTDLLGIVVSDQADVVHEIGEQCRYDAAVAVHCPIRLAVRLSS